jgi:hypothetical protein
MFRKKNDKSQVQKPEMSDKREDQDTGVQRPKSLVDTIPPTPRYPKPKILVIDLKDDTEAVLKAAGYTIEVGSFGTPYKIPEKSSSYLPVVTDFSLPNYAEQEIIIINLLPAAVLDQPREEKQTATGEYDHWAKCSYGVIDPRPVPMVIFRPAFNRILAHGGAFVVFADSHNSGEVVYARGTARGLDIDRSQVYDNWSFLAMLHSSRFGTNFVQGSEISVPNQKHPLGKLLARHIKGAYFNCTLSPKENIKVASYLETNEHFKAWVTMATDKYGAPVAGVFVPHDNIKGWVFIFPQIADKSRFLAEFMRDVLPEMAPHLFPFAEGGQWIHRDAYQLSSILEMKEQIQRIEAETKEKIIAIEESIQAEREETAYLHDLLTGTGDALVKAVKRALEVLGFKDVFDMDAEMAKRGDTGPKREDLRVVGEPVSLLIEVKGITGLPTDADSLQVQKYVIVRMREWNHTNVQGLEIINHQKGLPALDRENENPFRQDILVNAEDQQFGLMTTWDLYILTRNFLKNNWKPEHVKGLFFQFGRIQPVPAHYDFVGTVEEIWKKAEAVGVRIEAAPLKQGDRIAFRFPTDFEEQEVTSLQVDDESVSVAEVSTLVGIKTHLANQQIKKGIRIYRVIDSTH